MINHYTGFLNKCVMAFKEDYHLETASSMKQKTLWLLALVLSVSRMTCFSVITDSGLEDMYSIVRASLAQLFKIKFD